MPVTMPAARKIASRLILRVLEEALLAVESEHLVDPNPDSEGDEAYDRAVRDCAAALKQLMNEIPGEES